MEERSPDGAHLNYTAEQGMKAVIGGEQPKELLTDETFAAYVRECPESEATASYDGAARRAARYVLEWLEQHPGERWRPMEPEYDRKAFKAAGSPWDRYSDFVVVEGAWDMIERDCPGLRELGLSGFQAGWAWNAARKVLGYGPVKNPAIIEIGGG